MPSITVDVAGVGAKVSKLKADSALGMFVARKAREGMDPYVPYRTGYLSQTSAAPAPWEVSYLADYAVYVFYGKGMHFRTSPHPLATARWDKAYAAAHKGELADAITAYLKR